VIAAPETAALRLRNREATTAGRGEVGMFQDAFSPDLECRDSAPPRRYDLPVRRRLIHLLAFLSLLLCMGTVALWARGYSRTEFFRWSGTRTELELASGQGRVGFSRERIAPWRGTFIPGFFHSTGTAIPLSGYRDPSHSRVGSFAGVTWYAKGDVLNDDPFVTRGVELPAPAAAAALALAPCLCAGAAVRRRRNRPPPGHCRSCRYDLTGNVTGVCPECGSCSAS
jgi:hypothetical protein